MERGKRVMLDFCQTKNTIYIYNTTIFHSTNGTYHHSLTTNPQSSQVPGGQRVMNRRKAAQEKKQQLSQKTPTSTRAAGAGGSSSTMLKLYTDEAQGLKVDPLVVMVLAVGFIFSVVALHVVAKLTGAFLY